MYKLVTFCQCRFDFNKLEKKSEHFSITLLFYTFQVQFYNLKKSLPNSQHRLYHMIPWLDWPPEFALNYFSWAGFSFHLRQDEVVGMYVGFVGTCLLFSPGNQRYLQRKAQRPTLGANVHLPKPGSWATTNQRTREDPSCHQPSSVGTVQSQQPLCPLAFQAACRGKVQWWKHLSVTN